MTEKSNVDTTITTLEMCAGYGGIGLGLKNIFGERMRTVAYCELEGYAQANLVSKMEKGLLDAAPIWSDLKTFPYKDFHGIVDILIAGYPCQPFSAAGKRAGKEDPRHLWPWIADGIRLLRPRMCYFENVEGHISLGLREVIGELEELGYKVSWCVASASECLDATGRAGPHQRKRLFILAYDTSKGLPIGNRQRDEPEGQCNAEFKCGSHIAWPSRPGEPQHEWEPPRVVGNADKLRPQGGIVARSLQKVEVSRAELARDGGDSGRSEASETMGNAEQFLLPATREHGAMDEASGIPTDRKGSEPAQTDPIAGATRKREGDGADAAEFHEIKSSVGDPVDGTQLGVGIAELSGLSHQELAEICEWMVKTESRTDELRLLGNGVVPATAEIAYRVLTQELFNTAETIDK